MISRDRSILISFSSISTKCFYFYLSCSIFCSKFSCKINALIVLLEYIDSTPGNSACISNRESAIVIENLNPQVFKLVYIVPN